MLVLFVYLFCLSQLSGMALVCWTHESLVAVLQASLPAVLTHFKSKFDLCFRLDSHKSWSHVLL